jgi:alginate O-acetyltransferase complex protein AlgI
VFLVGGLWHGAAWTFVVWGALHGMGLVLLQLWRKLGLRLPTGIGVAVTFLYVVLCFTVFRAASVDDAFAIWRAAFGVGTFGIAPQQAAWAWLGTFTWATASWSAWLTMLPALALAAALVFAFARQTAHDIAMHIVFTPSRALRVGALAAVTLVSLPGATEFIYFIF